MKKVAFVVVLVAAIVGMVFGGLSVASAGFFDPTPHPTYTPRPTPTPDCCQAVNSKATNIQGNISDMKVYLNAIDGDVLNLTNNVASIQTDLANVTKMETISEIFYIPGDSGYQDIYHETYAEPRHVSLSFHYSNLAVSDPNAIKVIQMNADFGGLFQPILLVGTGVSSPESDWVTIDFNTSEWHILVTCMGGSHLDLLTVNFSATITYAASP